MKPDTEYLITWDIDNKQTQGIYTWKTSKDTYIKLTRTKDKKVTAPISVKMLIGNVYSPEGIDLDLSKSVPVK